MLFAVPGLCSQNKVTVVAVGDIMPGTSFPDESYLPPKAEGSLFRHVKKHLAGADITFGNLEGSLNNDEVCIKKCLDPKKCYAFRIPEAYAVDIADAGFNLLSLANNHIGDFGMPGRLRTYKRLSEHNIHFAGTEMYPTTQFRINNLVIGFTAFAPNAGTNDIRDIKKAVDIVQKLASTCDIVIVSFHGGAEGAEHRNVKKESAFFHGEDRGNVYLFAHTVIDAGADLVLGHGPHITKAVELYKQRLIAYSLGNFCTYARFNLLDHNGIAPLLKVSLNSDGTFLEGTVVSIKQEHKKPPIIDPDQTALKEIIELTAQDFPETPLTFGANGHIRVVTH